MAPPKPKKKRRSRSDPARREAAARRDEARRRAAEERRRQQEAAERRRRLKKRARRLALPVLVGLGVVVAAVFLFRPDKEVTGVERLGTADIMAALGYPDVAVPVDSLPGPVCGVAEVLTAEQLLADLRAGAVVLFHRPDDAATLAALEALANAYESHLVIAPSDRLNRPVLGVSWGRRLAFDSADDPAVAEFATTYRLRGPATADCPLPGA
ncbi:MAG: DUF3105 domain-containing protein [Actinobacteria bacterium]|nr:DUF3105 domain-containing protein [Actinomycetota bacterium]